VERLEAIVNRSPIMVFLWRDDPAYPVEYASKNVLQLGYSAEDFLEGRVSWPAITHPDDGTRLEAELEDHVREGRESWSQRFRLKTADGQWRWFEDNTRPVRDAAGRITHFEATVLDISEQVRCQEILEAVSFMDDLTGLHNRRAFTLLARQQLALARRNRLGVFLMYCDLDGLKEINDRLGHQVGDLAIKCLAAVLKSCVRSSDVVARLGGDEFVILGQETVPNGSAALETRIEEALGRRNLMGDLPFKLALSTGRLVMSAGQELDLDCMLDDADKLMYQHKRSKG
jgi:diguanylate cyclase (GGDEF)-like protein/PAS domain S-box-containing protein